MTSQPTVAVERAARGESFTVEYGGSLGFQYAPDIARAFIEASRRPTQAAPAFNLPADTMQVRSFLDLVTDITGIELSCGDDGLDLVDEGAADTWNEWITEWSTTPLVDAIRESIDIFSTQN
jgi:nucleoside-diphosphate-sugar epimerase